MARAKSQSVSLQPFSHNQIYQAITSAVFLTRINLLQVCLPPPFSPWIADPVSWLIFMLLRTPETPHYLSRTVDNRRPPQSCEALFDSCPPHHEPLVYSDSTAHRCQSALLKLLAQVRLLALAPCPSSSAYSCKPCKAGHTVTTARWRHCFAWSICL